MYKYIELIKGDTIVEGSHMTVAQQAGITEGVKYDKEKLRWELLPLKPIIDVVDILSYGATKYADENWRYVEPFEDRYYAAAMRHITAWRLGEQIDEESGKHHLAHAMCCLIFLMEGASK
jgi:hypothetical protein